MYFTFYRLELVQKIINLEKSLIFKSKLAIKVYIPKR